METGNYSIFLPKLTNGSFKLGGGSGIGQCYEGVRSNIM